jgi:hypothetical protein
LDTSNTGVKLQSCVTVFDQGERYLIRQCIMDPCFFYQLMRIVGLCIV